MNRDSFLYLCPNVSKGAEPHNNDRIYCIRINLDNYDYDYSHAIVTYLEACGCVIKETNHNLFGGFYIYYLKPTKYVSPEEFLLTYKEGVHYDNRTRLLRKLLFITFFILIPLALFILHYKVNK